MLLLFLFEVTTIRAEYKVWWNLRFDVFIVRNKCVVNIRWDKKTTSFKRIAPSLFSLCCSALLPCFVWYREERNNTGECFMNARAWPGYILKTCNFLVTRKHSWIWLTHMMDRHLANKPKKTIKERAVLARISLYSGPYFYKTGAWGARLGPYHCEPP